MSTERAVVYESVRSYLAEAAPEYLDELSHGFAPLYEKAEEQLRELEAGGLGPGERGLPFDPASFGAGLFVATLVWMALNVTRVAHSAPAGRELTKRIEKLESRLADQTGDPALVMKIRSIVMESMARKNEAGRQETGSAPVVPAPSGEPDLRILIDRRPDCLRFRLTSSHPGFDLHLLPFESPPFERSARQHFRELFQDIEQMPHQSEEDRAVAVRRLEGVGAQLAEHLLRPDLKHLLWDMVDMVRTVEIVSEDPWTPWELIRLRPPGGGAGEGCFLGEVFSVTRWIPGPRSLVAFPLRRLAVVVPGDTKIETVETERRFVLGLEGRQAFPVAATYLELTQALSTGGFDGLHFAGHASAWSESPERWGLQLEKSEDFKPADLTALGECLKGSRPLIFLNACASAQTGFSLTGLNGLAERFLQAGAGAVIGTLWAVRSSSALAFAEAFYLRFLRGMPLGEAVRESRHEVRDRCPGDPSWLAYTVFGHPLASVA